MFLLEISIVNSFTAPPLWGKCKDRSLFIGSGLTDFKMSRRNSCVVDNKKSNYFVYNSIEMIHITLENNYGCLIADSEELESGAKNELMTLTDKLKKTQS